MEATDRLVYGNTLCGMYWQVAADDSQVGCPRSFTLARASHEHLVLCRRGELSYGSHSEVTGLPPLPPPHYPHHQSLMPTVRGGNGSTTIRLSSIRSAPPSTRELRDPAAAPEGFGLEPQPGGCASTSACICSATQLCFAMSVSACGRCLPWLVPAWHFDITNHVLCSIFLAAWMPHIHEGTPTGRISGSCDSHLPTCSRPALSLQLGSVSETDWPLREGMAAAAIFGPPSVLHAVCSLQH